MWWLCQLSLTLTILTFSASYTFSQDSKDKNSSRPKYLEIGIQNGYSYHRDLATSPVFYRGATSGTNVHYHRFDSSRDSRFGISFNTGHYRWQIGNESAESQLQSFQLAFTELYVLERLSAKKNKLKVGGTILADLNIRLDPALQNASFGYELIYNLMASAKLSRDVSRNREKSGKFLWLIPYNWKPRKRLLSYQLNLGVFNSNVRNGYAYVNQSGLTNQFPLFADYENNLFSGFRMNAVFRYSIYLNNGNALRFSYIWDAYTTGGEVDQFEIANHLFGAALLFDLSNW